MNVTETLNEGLKREFSVVVPASTIDAETDQRIGEIVKTIRMPGFRPGKVPASLVKKRYGSALRGEVLEKAVNDSAQKALEERDLRPASQPRIEIKSFDEGGDLEFSMSIELMPEIQPVDFSTLSLERLVAEPGEDEMTAALGRLAEQHKTSEPVAEPRPAATGDITVINFTGRIDGEAFEGGTAEGHHLELGSGRFIPGFEDQLVGAEAGQKLDVTVTFPEDYGADALAGKEAVFETEVVEIREPKEAVIDDEFAKLFGMDSLDALKDAVKGQMGGEYEQASRTRLKRELLDKLEAAHEFTVPGGMLDDEYAAICQAVSQQAEQVAQADAQDQASGDDEATSEAVSGAESDEEATAPADEQKAVDEGLSDEDKAEYRKIAERRVKLGLLLQEVGRLNGITVSEDEVNRALYQEASKYPGQEQQVLQFYQQNQQARASLQAPLFEDKIVDFILELATVTEKTVSAEELFKEEEDEGEGKEGADA